MTKKTKNYIDNEKFYEELIKCQGKGKISNDLALMFEMVIDNYATVPFFSGWTYLDLMKSHAMVSCCAAFMKFDPERTKNPFSFFTQCTYYAFLQVLKDEKKHQDIRDDILIKHGLTPSDTYMNEYDLQFEEKRNIMSKKKEESNI